MSSSERTKRFATTVISVIVVIALTVAASRGLGVPDDDEQYHDDHQYTHLVQGSNET